jgi:hypothetical protein
MNSGTRKTLIAGTVGLAALGGIALARRRGAGDTEATTDGTMSTAMETGQSSVPMPAVMEMPAATDLERAQALDPAME